MKRFLSAPFIPRAWVVGIILSMIFPLPSPGLQSRAAAGSPSPQSLPDSIQHLVGKTAGANRQIALLLDRVVQYKDTDLSLAIRCAEAAKTLSERAKEEIFLGQSLYWLSLLKIRQYPFSESNARSMSQARICAEIFEKKQQTLWLARAYDLLASICYFQQVPEEGSSYIRKAIETIGRIKDPSREAQLVRAAIYQTKGTLVFDSDQDSARAWMEKSRNLLEAAGDSSELMKIRLNLATIHGTGANETLYQEAIGIFSRRGFRQDLANAYSDYASFCILNYQNSNREGWFEKGRNSILQAVALEVGGLCDLYKKLGQAYHLKAHLNASDRRLLNQMADSAFYFYQQALQCAESEDNSPCLRSVIDEMAKTCAITDNCPEVIVKMTKSYHKVFEAQKTSIRKAEEELRAYRQAELKAQSQKRQRNLILLAGMLGLSLLVLFIFYQRQRIRQLNKTLQAQLLAWQAQMNPHFISNTLDAIDSLVNFGRREDASHYLVQFSRLSRRILDNSENTLVSLTDEIDAAKDFLSLEQLRLNDMLSYEIEVDPGLDPDEIMIPPMLLQPFVENAIVHGIQKKQAPGTVRIGIKQAGPSLLECIVEDDGIGIEKSKALQRQSVFQRPSKALKITKDRIKALKGASLEITDLTASGSSGTRIHVMLPWKT